MKHLLRSVFLIGLLAIGVLHAQTSEQYLLERLDSRNGLSNSSVNSIFESADNMLWVGTWDGLNSFNGSDFRIFNYSQDLRHGLGNNVVEEITEDRDHDLWICTVEGISRFRSAQGEFAHYFYRNKDRNGGEKQFLLLMNNARIPMVYSPATGLQRYNSATAAFTPVRIALGESRVIQLLFTPEGDLWVLREDGSMNAYASTATGYAQRNTAYRQVHSMHLLNGRLFYTSINGDLSMIDGKGAVHAGHFDHPVKLITPYKDHYLVAYEGKGCQMIDAKFQPVNFLAEQLKGLQQSKVDAAHADSHGILWLGTDGNGLVRIASLRKVFEAVTNTSAGFRDNKQIRSFARVGTELWVGSKGNGILAFAYPSGSPAPGFRMINETSGLTNNSVYAIRMIDERWAMIGSDGEGVDLYDTHTRRFYNWSTIKGMKKAAFRSVYSILPLNDGTVLLGTSGSGLIRLKIGGEEPEVLSFTQYKYNGTASGPASDIIFSLATDHRGRVWTGCRYGGVSILDPATGVFSTVRSGSRATDLSHNDVLFVLNDSHDRMWIGTSYGLNMIPADYVNKPFTQFTTGKGLPNNTIHGIAEDKQGMIWVSTNNGLARIINNSYDVVRFTANDGLQSNEFSDGAVWKGPDGTLFFGGVYGFNYCEPGRILISPTQPNLQMSSLQLGGDNSITDGYSVFRPGGRPVPAEYNLDRYHNYFDLSIKAIDFINPQKPEYAYRLVGFERNWHLAGASGYVSYGNLPAGDYVLKVKWSNGEGQWTPEQDILTISVDQYLWFTPAAFLLYYVLVIIAIYVVYTYRHTKTEMNNRLELEYRLRLKEEKLHEEKLEFFTNIAHELQTPLTLIMGSVEHQLQQKQNDVQPVLSLVHQQSSRLAYLIQQLMEFRKAEEGKLDVSYIDLPASEYFGNIARLFDHFKKERNVSYNYEIEDGIMMQTDVDKLEKIIFNLLSNAFRYTAAGEKIQFHVYSSVGNHVAGNNNGARLEIMVANSGHSIPDREMDQLFDKFFTGSTGPGKFSSGLGLAFTRQLVTLLDGSIEAYCRDNWACFKVVLPLQAREGAQVKTAGVVQPSYLIRTIASEQPVPQQHSTEQLNKETLMQSIGEENKPVILVVEDEAPIRRLVRSVLSDMYLIYEAANGKEALHFLKSNVPQLIISDIMMEDMTGLELCHEIKQIPATCHIPFLLLSARSSADQQLEGFQAGADGYLPKPFHTAHLVTRVGQLLQNSQRLHKYFKTKGTGADLPKGLPDEDRMFIEDLHSIIVAELDNPELDASLIETRLGVSRIQLYRRIRTISGMTPSEFIRNVRLGKAAEMLAGSRQQVAEIFYQTGFNNQSYFFREFRKKYNCTPNEYRAARQVKER